ncbi:MAG TPA: STAS domain-containing protein [Spirochaetota bacterium]|nr:STAS domain-containing protein [Spirochaetota bacterium]HNT11738.1 STAS domain-containing protein [Spirochaetota bacterium]HNV47204.1 STAS domain-containing protein [Spirochaetota bacterium]HOS40760.1 STAS domain-containing protein [Spirochaetota bacterium]HPU88693.1 STAS domain-containing protein [Spirochaetota bacterium]
MEKMEIKTTRPWDRTAMLRLSGKFNIEQVVPFEEAVGDALQDDATALGIDMSHVEYVDSSAIGCLIKYANVTKGKGVDLYLLDLKPDIRLIFKTAYLDKFFNFITHEEFKRRRKDA